MSQHKKNQGFRIAGSILISMIAFSFCFWLSYLLTNFIYRYTGTPAKPWTYILTGILGLYIFAAGVKIIVDANSKKFKHFGRDQIIEEALDAMKRITQGDFSVVMKVEKHDPFSELAETINKMAHGLGTMENLRQDFIANVSHEIQSPLTSISGFAELLRNNSIIAEERVHYIDIIEAESKRLSKLSDNLLKLSSLDANATPLSFSKFRLDKQIQNSLLMLEPQWSEKNLDISLELEAVYVFGDKNLMAQVWINLLHNAIKFTPNGGTITITTSNGDYEVVCRIADNGIGISDEDKLHIFERFYKVDKARDRNLGGNGLGLSLVKKIVELHKGTIHVESEVGAGTIFSIKLPK
ncbi:HAMP domain-containing sensor histidine kinase [Anaerocolumna xylanovorans]|uniref:histidine kinase n=1 Tax=Anaerocolumna xylanovorans DSM 12503 TaxID=1121345 RepID=A0A1M7Y9G9_9FIRM|nr:HAMP domain-containing sensor histidine kinase [Anaerocolumna xylanovorans]SHO49178.1 Signal transduction histidine kinase [Anaerocolumna xylanovorans DSM 12503]